MALENRLGLTSSADLAREEERISKKKALELFESGKLDRLEAGNFSALKAIHKYLFDEIYDFAGELRTVNLARGNFRFAPVMYLEAALENIDKMPQSTFDEIVEKYYERHRPQLLLRGIYGLQDGRIVKEEKYSMVVVANVSDTTAMNLEAYFKRLTLWGFIVVGNDDRQARS